MERATPMDMSSKKRTHKVCSVMRGYGIGNVQMEAIKPILDRNRSELEKRGMKDEVNTRRLGIFPAEILLKQLKVRS